MIGRLRSGRREQLLRAEPRVDLGALAPPIADHLERVMTQERRIRDAIDRAELPFEEVSQEVDTFVRAAQRAAARAQLLYEYISEEDPRRVEGRLEQLRAGGPSAEPGAQALADALETQLRAMKRVHEKLERFYGEMERIAIELANVRGQLLSVSATTEATAQRELATGVRNLREHVGAVAEGMSEVLDETRATAT